MVSLSVSQASSKVKSVNKLNNKPRENYVLMLCFSTNLGGVGKSCLMNRFVSNRYDENSFHTIGVEFMNKDLEVDGEKYTLQVSWKSVNTECNLL